MGHNVEPRGITIGRSFISIGDLKRGLWFGLPSIILFIIISFSSSLLVALKLFGFVLVVLLFVGFCVYKACDVED